MVLYDSHELWPKMKLSSQDDLCIYIEMPGVKRREKKRKLEDEKPIVIIVINSDL